MRIAALVLLLLPAVAQAEDNPFVGSLEFSFGFGGNYEVDPDSGPSSDTDAVTGISITPAIEKMLGSSVAIGVEWMFTWIKADTDFTEDDDRRLIMSPNLRARMSFPIIDKVTFDAMIGLGPTIWTSYENKAGVEDDTDFGWTLRFNFGGSYKFNDSVAAFASLGYLSSTSYNDDATVTYSEIPLNLGLRGSF